MTGDINGTKPGLANGLGAFGASGIDIGDIINVQGSPNGVVEASYELQIAWDGEAQQAYQAITTGSSWVKIGSKT